MSLLYPGILMPRLMPRPKLSRPSANFRALGQFGTVSDRYFWDGFGQFGTVWVSLGWFGTDTFGRLGTVWDR